MLLVLLAVVSVLAFCYYGSVTLFARPPRVEYERFGLAHARVLIGSLELLGAAGVLLGLFAAPLGAVSAAGLTSMMVLGLVARWRARDAPRLMIPAGSLGVLNAVLVYLFLDR